MANGLRESLQGISRDIGAFSREKLALQQAQQLRQQKISDALTLEKAKAKIEQDAFKLQEKQAREAGLIGEEGSPFVSIGGGFEKRSAGPDPLKQAQADFLGRFTQGQNVGGFQPKSVSVGGFTFEKQETDEERKIKEEQKIDFEKRLKQAKGVSGEAAIRVAGAKQGLQNIKDIKDILKFSTDPQGKVSIGKGAKGKLVGRALADVEEPKLLGFPLTFGLTKQASTLFAGKEGRQLDLAFDTLAENILRARTGAAAPEPEQVRELSRTLIRFLDDPETGLKRLDTNKLFFDEVLNAINPPKIDSKLDSDVNKLLDRLGAD